MLLKPLNLGVRVAHQVFNFIVVLYCATLLARFTWWVITPATSNIYVENFAANNYSNSFKYIINRYPFGVITKIESATNLPQAISAIKLIGVYYNPPKDSMAFIEYQNSIKTITNNNKSNVNSGPTTSVVVQTGGTIVDNVTVQKIDLDSIVIAQSGTTGVLHISGESAILSTSAVSLNNLNNSANLYNRYNHLPAQERREINKFMTNNPNNNNQPDLRHLSPEQQKRARSLAKQFLNNNGNNQ